MGNIRYIILLLSLFSLSFCVNEDINIVTYFSKMTEQTLKDLAIATEKYSREKVKISLKHSISEYYALLKDMDVIDYLLREIKAHPELTYEKYTTELKVTIEVKEGITKEEQLKRLPLKMLIDLLLTCEMYENQKYQTSKLQKL